MKEVVPSRAVALVVAAAIIVITACSDSGSTQPNLSGPNPSAASGSHGAADTAKSGGTHDSSGSHTPATKPVATFTLKIHIGSPQPGATDTIATNPVQNATIKVMIPTSTFVGGSGGSDTVFLSNTVVATGSSDANGNVSFPNLKGDAIYLIRADPPPGSALGPATVDLIKAYADVVSLQMILHGR